MRSNDRQNALTTESGAYSLNGATSPLQLNSVSRSPGAQWFIPTQNEWYKAAFHKDDGVTGDYWAYPTSSNVAPTSVTPPGNGAATPSNTANFFDSGYAVTGSSVYSSTQNYLTDAGAYILASSPYGTFDQGGNVNEWTETVMTPFSRNTRGGGWADGSAPMKSNDDSGFVGSSVGDPRLGFRVATVPEPVSAVMAIIAGAMLIGCGRTVRKRC